MSLPGIYLTDTLAQVLTKCTMLFIAVLMQLGRKLEIIQISINRLIIVHMDNAILRGCKINNQDTL